MKNVLILSSVIVICLLVSTPCFADIVHFNNGFIYSGDVKQDAETGEYWVDGALVHKSEIKKIEKTEFTTTQDIEEDRAWYEKFFSALPSFNKNNKNKSQSRISQFLTVTQKDAPSAKRSKSYSGPKQAPSSRAHINYSGRAQSMWQNIRRHTGIGAKSTRSKNAGYITKRNRFQDSRKVKNSSAGYLLRNERRRIERLSGPSKRNSAGYALLRQRRLTERELSSF